MVSTNRTFEWFREGGKYEHNSFNYKRHLFVIRAKVIPIPIFISTCRFLTLRHSFKYAFIFRILVAKS